ncbi:hypothetical protein OOZ54_12615 [Rhodopseudomonas palustris]|uniref:hypothetical protein n=1 Tax=Rhodopseudomonas palustris TaxID=1076 RepID=UPI0022F0A2A4|nr:hypothetical protein [Rhodopseudomonas palustris]WBU27537.1 hypothetical protein OOZ54_12615 [Rhodopseudomonas palustris]
MTVPARSDRGEPELPPDYREIELMAKELLELRVACLSQSSPSTKLIQRLDAAIVALKQIDLDAARQTATRPEVVVYLGMLIKCYPAGAQDAKIFGRLLREDILQLDPPRAAVAIACRRCRLKYRFMPSIAEIVEETRSIIGLVTSAVEFASRIGAERDRLAKDR